MKRAIHFGAGKIGRGFIGALLSQAGYEVCFAEADPQLVDEINRRRGYTVHVMDEICAELRIAGVSAVQADSGEAVRRLVDARSGDDGRRAGCPASGCTGHRRRAAGA